MRHTAISMHLAVHKHEGETASWADNSPNVIHRHYKGLVKEADAKEFWSLTPKTVKSTIAKLPAKLKVMQITVAAWQRARGEHRVAYRLSRPKSRIV